MPGFDLLTPQAVMQAVSQGFDLRLSGSLTPYPSYINRVYGLEDEDEDEFIVKFYRPGRWSFDAVLEEHQFLRDCEGAELPVIPPLPDEEGETLLEMSLVDESGEEEDICFALFPKRGGRNFDAEGEEEWLRLGRLLGRLHSVARERQALHRVTIDPRETTARQIEELVSLIHPDFREAYEEFASETVRRIAPSFEGLETHRIHGDCHRGNILDRPGDGLLLIDFDDMAVGPAVQDLWLLLPGHREECRREIGLLLEGYEEFLTFPRESLELIEPLRFMRMIHYSAWCSRQRFDEGFLRHFPDWGSRAYWVKELEDLKEQARVLAR